MKALLVLTTLLALAPIRGESEEDFRFLTANEWYIDSGIDVHYDQTVLFRRNELPRETVFYKEKFSLDGTHRYLSFFYDYTGDHVKVYDVDDNKDGRDDTLNVVWREGDSLYIFENPDDKLISSGGGGKRQGPVADPDHPLVGLWGHPDNSTSRQVRLVKSDDYSFFMNLPTIRHFAFRRGWYLLKYLGDNIFETDDTFPDGRLRLEVKNAGQIILTPLFALPASEGLLDSVLILNGHRR